MSDAGDSHVLEARGVRFAYRGGRAVVDGVDLTAAAGRLICILGPNGSGKTTLLRCLLRQLRCAGEILLDARPIGRYSQAQLARLMAYVPQVPQVSFAFSVREIVLMGRYVYAGPLGLVGQKDYDVAEAAMEMTATTQFADRSLDSLSGGEAQRVMIARALAQQPSVCLLDEPTSHLDIASQLSIYRMMQRLAHEWKMAVVCVSHDINMAARFADELLVMRAGRVLADGTAAEVITPEVLRAAYDVDVELIPVASQAAPLVRVLERRPDA